MIRLLELVRGFLPAILWRLLRDRYWSYFWQKERRADEQRFSVPVPDLRGSERAVLIETIADLYPFSNLLEVGCAYGQNFHILAPLFSGTRMIGIDSDQACVEEGNQILEREGLSNAQLSIGDGRDLSRFADSAFDIVLSSAFLLYVDEHCVDQVLRELIRVSRRQLVLLEQHRPDQGDDPQGRGVFVRRKSAAGGYWIRDYERLLRRLAPESSVTLQKVERPIWTSESWSQHAHVIVLSHVS